MRQPSWPPFLRKSPCFSYQVWSLDTRSVQRARFNAGFYKRLDASCSTFMRFRGVSRRFCCARPTSSTLEHEKTRVRMGSNKPNANYVRYLRTYTGRAQCPDASMREVRYVKGLDGLRALAVILVFLSHKGHVLAV
ncbi:TPA: acyltransferase family protein, partial [Burkholderia cenocepacia]